ncbi:hypothetical protein MKX01_017626 [Papaver californicum]|nr:hypothetical protein MKX01_017626 [Papaver californicum]
MAVSSSFPSSLIGLLVFLFTITASTATRDVKAFDLDAQFDVGKICPLVKNKDYCENLLQSYPSIYGFDVKGVGTVFVYEATYKATDAKNKIMDLFPKAAGAQKIHLKYCQRFYDSFRQKDKKILSQLLGKKDYSGLHREAGILAKYATDCESSFNPAPSPMKRQNDNFLNLMDMISALSFLLIHQ